MIRVILMNVNPPMLMTLRLSANEYLFSILRLTTGTVLSALLQFEPKFGGPRDGKQA